MDEIEKKKAEEAKAAEEATQKALADAQAAEADALSKIDYKAIAESNAEMLAAEKARADAAEALITKNKALLKRQEIKDEEDKPLTRKEALELIEATKIRDDDDSVEAKALIDANKRVKELEAKNTEIARALKAKDGVSKDSTTTHFDGSPNSDPKLPDNSPLKAYKYLGNGVYSKKLVSGKTMFRNANPGPGQQKTWVE